MSVITSSCDLLNIGKDDAIAIDAPDRSPLSYSQLRNLSARTQEALNSAGIGRNDRVAIVLPNGPEMATAFVCIAGAATTAPLNPAYKQEEFEFYLEDLNAKALVLQEDSDSPAATSSITKALLSKYWTSSPSS